ADGDAGAERRAVADGGARADDAVGADDDALAERGGGIDDGGGMDAGGRGIRAGGDGLEDLDEGQVGVGDVKQRAGGGVVAGDFDHVGDQGRRGAAGVPAAGVLAGAD